MTLDPKCQNRTRVSRVKVQENGRSAAFINEERQIFIKTRIDGCIINQSVAADWLVTGPGQSHVIIELKGKNVEHAAKQILETARFLKETGAVPGKWAGLIVCSQYPRASTTIQRAQISFRENFGGPLHVVTQNLEFHMNHVLSARGPLRA